MTNSVHWLVAGIAVAAPLGLYLTFLGLSAIPFFQRHFLYAHKFNTLFWHDLNRPEYWGFAKNQVTPFTLTTADGQSLYAWHILPLQVYAQHESELAAQDAGFCHKMTQSVNFKLLRDDPNARLVIYFHGNAGHVAQAIRPASYHALTDGSPSTHVLAIDYRGFGHSTGSPTEQGLILDGTAAVDWAMQVAGIPSSRIVLLGQSLGTAVTSGVAEHFSHEGVDFAGVILVSGFSSLPTMLSGYAIAGWVPVLRPLAAWPWLLRKVTNRVVDKWESAQRLGEVVRTVKQRNGRLRLTLVHAKNDWDIPFHEDDKLFAGAVNGTLSDPAGMGEQVMEKEKEQRTTHTGEDAWVAKWKDGDVVVRQEVFPYGGHNDIMYYAPVLLSVMRSFGLDEATKPVM
ncbi:Alpha/Beta hydrolase protein [Diplogelasinospora grovesii]|uniref:Alpha/Beta hydrolase protein n=1 Tax=Diplogelasinospora grovesii TaxID=303347 RepID=A0AAN6N1S4_9PEZI|nr:Alpha/Beta hydrolase protein [Diplogelasinospora grovesii]